MAELLFITPEEMTKTTIIGGNVDIDKYTTDESTKELLRRPLALLTVNDVDIALFELGLNFENTLKQFLLQKKSKGEITVNSKDTSKLVNMVNCVVREGIVTKGHHLSTLREERNNRAHGEPPSIQERRELFNKAHYISDLFVKYICFFPSLILSSLSLSFHLSLCTYLSILPLISRKRK